MTAGDVRYTSCVRTLLRDCISARPASNIEHQISLVVAARHRAAATGIEVELEMSIEGQDDVSEKLEMDPRLPDTVVWLDEEPPRKAL
jgi:hypothetical protein